MKKYTFTLTSDSGIHKITIYARNIASAVQQILNAEGCPEGAILNIEIRP